MEREETKSPFKEEFIRQLMERPTLKTPGVDLLRLGNKAYQELEEDNFAIGEYPGSNVCFVDPDPLKGQELERTGKVIPFHREIMPHRNIVTRKITEREVVAASLLASAATVGIVAWRKGWIKKAWELTKRVIYSGQRLNI